MFVTWTPFSLDNLYAINQWKEAGHELARAWYISLTWTFLEDMEDELDRAWYISLTWRFLEDMEDELAKAWYISLTWRFLEDMEDELAKAWYISLTWRFLEDMEELSRKRSGSMSQEGRGWGCSLKFLSGHRYSQQGRANTSSHHLHLQAHCTSWKHYSD